MPNCKFDQAYSKLTQVKVRNKFFRPSLYLKLPTWPLVLPQKNIKICIFLFIYVGKKHDALLSPLEQVQLWKCYSSYSLLFQCIEKP